MDFKQATVIILDHPKKVYFFANCNFQYVQYSAGTSWAVPCNCTPVMMKIKH